MVYGFGPPRDVVPSPSELNQLTPSAASFVGITGDLGIIEGRWQVVPGNEFVRNEWPMPAFAEYSEPAGVGLRVDYPEGHPGSRPTSSIVSATEARSLPSHVVHGYVAFETQLARSLGMAEAALGEYRGPAPAFAEHRVSYRSERVAKSAAQQMLKAVPNSMLEIDSANGWLVRLRHGPDERSLNFNEVIDRLRNIAMQRKGNYLGWEAIPSLDP